MTRGGFGSKVHLMTEGSGLPIGIVLTQGNRNECPVFAELLDQTLLATGGVVPQRLAADRGYSSDKLRRRVRSLGMEVVIPYRKNEHVHDRPPLNTQAYKPQRDRAMRGEAEGDATDLHAVREAGQQLPGHADAGHDGAIPAGVVMIRQTVPRVRGRAEF